MANNTKDIQTAISVAIVDLAKLLEWSSENIPSTDVKSKINQITFNLNKANSKL